MKCFESNNGSFTARTILFPGTHSPSYTLSSPGIDKYATHPQTSSKNQPLILPNSRFQKNGALADVSPYVGQN